MPLFQLQVLYYSLIPIILILLVVLFFTFKKYLFISNNELVNNYPSFKNFIKLTNELNDNKNLLSKYNIKFSSDETPYINFENLIIYESVLSREQYATNIGTSRLGIFNISGTKRSIKKGYAWTKIGKGEIIITNKKLYLINENITNKIYLKSIEQIVPLNKKEIILKTFGNRLPFRLKFPIKLESFYFANIFFTILDQKIKKEKKLKFYGSKEE